MCGLRVIFTFCISAATQIHTQFCFQNLLSGCEWPIWVKMVSQLSYYKCHLMKETSVLCTIPCVSCSFKIEVEILFKKIWRLTSVLATSFLGRHRYFFHIIASCIEWHISSCSIVQLLIYYYAKRYITAELAVFCKKVVQKTSAYIKHFCPFFRKIVGLTTS